MSVTAHKTSLISYTIVVLGVVGVLIGPGGPSSSDSPRHRRAPHSLELRSRVAIAGAVAEDSETTVASTLPDQTATSQTTKAVDSLPAQTTFADVAPASSPETAGATTTQAAPTPPRTSRKTRAQVPYTPRHKECAEALSIASKAGWPNWALSHLEPIMWRESNCRYGLTNYNTDGTTDWGLMQINDTNVEMLKSKGIISTAEELFNPYINLKASLVVYRFFDNSFCPWKPHVYCG